LNYLVPWAKVLLNAKVFSEKCFSETLQTNNFSFSKNKGAKIRLLKGIGDEDAN
jgi:hypothetical protein